VQIKNILYAFFNKVI